VFLSVPTLNFLYSVVCCSSSA